MNEFEQRLARQTFRAPPAEFRAEILAAVTGTPPAGTWREWLWPSPRAWAAMAAIWLVCAALRFADQPATSPAEIAAQKLPESDIVALLLAMRDGTDLLHDRNN
jgi:hypothetical protein